MKRFAVISAVLSLLYFGIYFVVTKQEMVLFSWGIEPGRMLCAADYDLFVKCPKYTCVLFTPAGYVHSHICGAGRYLILFEEFAIIEPLVISL